MFFRRAAANPGARAGLQVCKLMIEQRTTVRGIQLAMQHLGAKGIQWGYGNHNSLGISQKKRDESDTVFIGMTLHVITRHYTTVTLHGIR